MPLISSQATTLDYLRQPWVYDPDIGPIVAPRAPQSGDGMYRYKFGNADWVVEKNPSPTTEMEFRARFEDNIQRISAKDEFVDSDEEPSPPPPPSLSSLAPVRQVVKRPPVSSHLPRLDKNAHYDALLKEQGCVIAPKKRESTGRMDMQIYDSASGKRFRSRLEAMRFFNITV